MGKSLQVESDPVLAAPTPDPDGPLAGQHDARVLPDGDVTIHDNGTHFTGAAWTGRAPRAGYAIDETAMRATFVEQSTDPDVGQSLCCGGSRLLPGGNWVTAWGGRQKVSEAPPDGTRVFNLDFAAPIFTYRANPILPTQLSARTVRTGMDTHFPRTALSITGASPDFGDVTVATAGATRTFAVTNTAAGAVQIAGVTLTGADASAFALTGETCAGETLAASTAVACGAPRAARCAPRSASPPWAGGPPAPAPCACSTARGGRTISSRLSPLSPTCTYRRTVTFSLSPRLRDGLTAQARYLGNRVSRPMNSRTARATVR